MFIDNLVPIKSEKFWTLGPKHDGACEWHLTKQVSKYDSCLQISFHFLIGTLLHYHYTAKVWYGSKSWLQLLLKNFLFRFGKERGCLSLAKLECLRLTIQKAVVENGFFLYDRRYVVCTQGLIIGHTAEDF